MLDKMNSGYSLNDEDWTKFIKCWKSAQINNKKSEGAIPNFKLDYSNGKSISVGKDHLNAIEVKGLVLSKSIQDFYLAFKNLGGEYVKPNELSSIGMFSPNEIKHLNEYSPELIQIESEWSLDSSDDEYFKYGKEQDYASGRFSNFKDSIVIGRYGFSAYELILVYPNSLTKDQEMEVAIISNAYEFRAPSFAEMMRQISVLDIEHADTMPPYSQKKLKGTCADKLPLSNVWWK